MYNAFKRRCNYWEEGLELEYIEYMKNESIALDESEEGKKYKWKFLEILNNFENNFNKKEKEKENKL